MCGIFAWLSFLQRRSQSRETAGSRRSQSVERAGSKRSQSIERARSGRSRSTERTGKERSGSSGRDEEKQTTNRSATPTRLMFDMVNHMFHMQSALRNIHHELQVQTDILRTMRDNQGRTEPQRRTPERRPYKRPAPFFNRGPAKRFDHRK